MSAPVPAPAPAPLASSRPSALVGACVLTWVGAGLTAGVMLLGALVLVVAPDSTMQELTRANPELIEQGVSTAMLQVAAVVVAGVIALWCVAAAVLAALAWRRTSWAHLALVISAVLAAAVCLLGAVANAVLIVPLLGCVSASVLLLRAEVRAWVSGAAR